MEIKKCEKNDFVTLYCNNVTLSKKSVTPSRPWYDWVCGVMLHLLHYIYYLLWKMSLNIYTQK